MYTYIHTLYEICYMLYVYIQIHITYNIGIYIYIYVYNMCEAAL